MAVEKKNEKDRGFKTSSDGRLIIEEQKDTDFEHVKTKSDDSDSGISSFFFNINKRVNNNYLLLFQRVMMLKPLFYLNVNENETTPVVLRAHLVLIPKLQ